MMTLAAKETKGSFEKKGNKRFFISERAKGLNIFFVI